MIVFKQYLKQFLEKLSKYEKRDKQHILYDILYKDNENSLLHTHSKSTLIYLCDLYLNIMLFN